MKYSNQGLILHAVPRLFTSPWNYQRIPEEPQNQDGRMTGQMSVTQPVYRTRPPIDKCTPQYST